MRSSTTCSLCSILSSSIGRKIIVALTGLALVLFLVGHLTGNLLVFAGSAAFNDYAAFLHHLMHGAGIWIARIGLLVCFVAHIVFTILLTKQNRAAGGKYAYDATVQASRSSKIMIWSGLTILAFVFYHLLHYTVRVANDYDSYVDAAHLAATGESRHDAYRMVIEGFSWAPATIFYVIAITLLCSHLSHGVASIFQTLGLRSQKTAPLINRGSQVFAIAIYLGFISIPLSIWLFGLGR